MKAVELCLDTAADSLAVNVSFYLGTEEKLKIRVKKQLVCLY